MIEQLFGSKTRVKLLQLFLSNPNRAFYVREITRKVDEQINSVRRELANLLSIGILASENKDNRLYYEVNQDYEHYAPLRAIFTNIKTDEGELTGAQAERSLIKSLGSVEVIALTGRFTGDTSAGVDLLIVGDVNPTALQHYISGLEKEAGHEIDYALMSAGEFIYRKEIKDRFIGTMETARKTVLHDPKHLLTPPEKPAKPAKTKK